MPGAPPHAVVCVVFVAATSVVVNVHQRFAAPLRRRRRHPPPAAVRVLVWQAAIPRIREHVPQRGIDQRLGFWNLFGTLGVPQVESRAAVCLRGAVGLKGNGEEI